jgi:hypothetical protein
VEVRVFSGALKKCDLAGLFDAYDKMGCVTETQADQDERLRRDAEVNAAARAQMMRADGARPLGENLVQADGLIRLTFELAGAASAAR